MDANKLMDALDEKLFSDKIFKKIYTFYAFWIVSTPILETIFHCMGLTLNIMFQVMTISALFGITKFLELVFNFRKITIKNKTIIDLLVACLFICFMISSVVNRTYKFNFYLAICYFLFYVLFSSINKKIYKPIAILFICEMVLDSLLGLIDLNNKFIPGFLADNFVMSMQFLNPNWSAFVVIIAVILSLWFIFSSQKTWQKALYFTGLVIMTVGLFVGGSYAPETSIFLCELALIIFLWIKYKKCPWWIVAAFLTTIFISFAVWFVPALRSVSTANANYFYETLAVIDDKIGTHFVENVSAFFDRVFGWGKLTGVAGSDGWDRSNLESQAFKAIFSSPKSFIFGYGSAFIYTIRVHNCFIVMWMEFGIVAFLIYLAIFAMLLVRFVKVKKTDEIVFLFSLLVMLLFESLFCCIEPTCFPFFVIFSAVLYKKLYSAELKETKKVNENMQKEQDSKENLSQE